MAFSVEQVTHNKIASHENSRVSFWRKSLESRTFQTQTIRRLWLVRVGHFGRQGKGLHHGNIG